jgi:tyrosyl-tRNA synthetase
MDPLQTLRARGFVQQVTHEEELSELLRTTRMTVYCGFDPSADSLHVGHLLPVFALAWMQRLGHRVIAVVGGGTGQVGDPSGKTEMRRLLDQEAIARNVEALRQQIGRYLTIDGENGILVDNAEWLMDLGYISFLRDIGRHFSVNRMLAAEAYKQRLERGLSFIEFNYQLLQAYDFLELNRRFGCNVQIGGDDQWGNILAGVELVRRADGHQAYGLTLPLLLTASGTKMGKTAGGAVWLSADRMAPFDYHQYWLNVDDRDVGKLLRAFTFLPIDEIERLEALEGADIRQAKAVLAREATTLAHGAEAAATAEAAGRAMVAGAAADDLPTHEVGAGALAAGEKLYALLADAGLVKSRGEARRMIKGGGVRLNGEKVDDPEAILEASAVGAEGAVLRVGKKRAVRIVRSPA